MPLEVGCVQQAMLCPGAGRRSNSVRTVSRSDVNSPPRRSKQGSASPAAARAVPLGSTALQLKKDCLLLTVMQTQASMPETAVISCVTLTARW